MTVGKAHNGTAELVYETLGSPDGEPLLLIAGHSAQLVVWPDEFCLALADRGFAVARFDNRDSGLSTHFDSTKRPGWLRMLLRLGTGPVYHLEDMVEDTAVVMDALGWGSAHLVGMASGGLIAQAMAIAHPARVRTLVQIAGGAGFSLRRLHHFRFGAIISMAKLPRDGTRAGEVDFLVQLQKLCSATGHPFDEADARAIAQRCADRRVDDANATMRQLTAIRSSTKLLAKARTITAPTLVLFGADHPLEKVANAKAITQIIPGSRLIVYPGVGAELPRRCWPEMINEIHAHTGQSVTPAA